MYSYCTVPPQLPYKPSTATVRALHGYPYGPSTATVWALHGYPYGPSTAAGFLLFKYENLKNQLKKVKFNFEKDIRLFFNEQFANK